MELKEHSKLSHESRVLYVLVVCWIFYSIYFLSLRISLWGIYFSSAFYCWKICSSLMLSDSVAMWLTLTQGLQHPIECFSIVSFITSGCSLSVPGPHSRRVSRGLTSAHFSSVSSSILGKDSPMDQCSSKCGPQPISIRIMEERVNVVMKNSDPRLIESKYR